MNETNDILEIQPPVDLEPLPDGPGLVAYIVIVLLLLAGAALLFWALRKQPKPKAAKEPDTVAQRKLRAAWALLGTPALFAEAVADTLRVYLEERFNAHAPERTTEEFLNELQTMPQMTGPQKDLLGKFLSFCDLSKFAQHDPTEDECRRLHAIAVQLINETAPPSPGAAPPRLVPPQLN